MNDKLASELLLNEFRASEGSDGRHSGAVRQTFHGLQRWRKGKITLHQLNCFKERQGQRAGGCGGPKC